MDNLQFYNRVRAVPKEALKEIQAGRLKGKSDINPMWRLKTLTEVFGACGLGWKYEITKQWLEPGANEIAAFCNINLYIKHQGEWSEAIPGTGGSAFVAQESKGPYVSDECFKMALTDAISVACKALGFGADVYWQSDKTKYNAEVASKTETTTKAAIAAKPPNEITPNKPTPAQFATLIEFAKKKGVDLKVSGVTWTGKGSSKEWTNEDFLKVMAKLELLEDKK